MGAWGITMRESDYGLDLLSVIVEEQLKPVQFAYFDAANAIALLRQYILNEINTATGDAHRRNWTTTSRSIFQEILPRRRF